MHFALFAQTEEEFNCTALESLAEIGEALKEQGLTLEDMIESGWEIREELFREQYGHLDTDSS